MSNPYSSPNESRAAQPRRGGRGFYKDRGREHDEKPKHEYRDQRRSPEEREAAALGRELAALAVSFPRFRGDLNRLRHHVLVQTRSEEWKHQVVFTCLGPEPVAVEEIVEETDLDRQSVGESLAYHEAKGAAVRCNRNGDAIVIRSDGKPAEKVYWLKVVQRPTSNVQGQIAAGK